MNDLDLSHLEKYNYRQDISVLELNNGRQLVVDLEKQEIIIRDRERIMQMRVIFDGNGLNVEINASQLNIVAEERLSLSAKKVEISAVEQIVFKSSGNVINEIGGDCISDIGGVSSNRASIQKIEANLGNVEIRANDNVRIDGESLLFNCD